MANDDYLQCCEEQVISSLRLSCDFASVRQANEAMVESDFVLRKSKQTALKTSKEQVNPYCGLSRRRF